MQTNHDKAAIAIAKNSQKTPRTQVEALREILNDLELRITRLGESNSQDALQVLTMLDQAVAILSGLHRAGGVTGSEDSYFGTIKAQFHAKRRQFISRIGGAAALAKARQERQPPEDHWWWFIDQALAQERRALMRRVLVIGGIAVLLLAGLFVVYQRFWKPDPAYQASIGFQTAAENFLLEGRYEEALREVNRALAQTPERFELYLLRGVLYTMLDQPEMAADDFEVAWGGYSSADQFYSERARYYLMTAQPELALADAEAAIELNPDSAIGYLRKGQAYEALGDVAMAIESYELASDVAEQAGDPQLQVIARMSLGQLLQSVPPLTTEPEN